ncbi:SWI/SNF-related matrix-associated actin-dependent regulator of chromatin subfamily A-like protein 1 [Ptychodera flava]|uniref:SWI/SNF-related matrix-associated actin-dependent regulator of chromatin subfamily A-like protein 1 n=1 Tax=Ptychodera flava TaxID=63121 RepID=UPI00396A41EE
MSSLTQEQLQRIEENKRRALARRAEKLSQHTGGTKKPPNASGGQQTNQFAQKQSQFQQMSHSSTGHLRSQPNSPSQNRSKQFTSSTSLQFSKNSSPVKALGHECKPDIMQRKFGTSTQFSNSSHSVSNQTQFTSVPSRSSNTSSLIPSNQPVAGSSTAIKPDSANSMSVAGLNSVKSFYSTNKSSGVKSTSQQTSWQTYKTEKDNASRQSKATGSPPKAAPLFGGVKTLKGDCELMTRDRFVVNVGFNAQLVDVFKSIESRSYDASTKKWNFALKDYSNLLDKMKSLPVQIEPLPSAVLRAFHAQLKGKDVFRDIPEQNLNNIDSKLVDSLMPFQRDGVNFVISRRGRALIADDMGLGKTIQSICIACYYRTEWPLLVVVPSSVKLTWAEAFRRWVPSLDPQRINVVMTSKDKVTTGLVNIISYDMMTRKATELKAQRFQVVIMDESHSLKNFKTARTKAAMPILRSAPRVLLLSGTPALSRPSELYTQIAAVDPKLLPSFHDFGVRYCAGRQNPWGWDYSGSSHMTELQILLEERIMIRRLKKDVLQQLPSKTRQMILMDPGVVKTNSQSLKAAAKQMARAGQNKKEQRGALLQYFSESGTAKIQAVTGYIFDLLDSGHKFLIFAHHQTMLDALSESLSEKGYLHIRIDGSTSSDKRKQLCDRFQSDDDYRVAVLSITAASTGLTLHAASLVVFAELFWNPGVLVQAEDRVYRIGQKNCVNIHYLVAKGTADDYIWPLVQEKLNVLSKAGLTKDDFSEADTKSLKDPEQKSILNYFEESFMEEAGEDELKEIAALEAAAYVDTSEIIDREDGQTEVASGIEKNTDRGRHVSENQHTMDKSPSKGYRVPTVKKQKTLFQTMGGPAARAASPDSQDEEPVIKRARRK